MMRYALRRLLILPLTLVLAAVVIVLLPVAAAAELAVFMHTGRDELLGRVAAAQRQPAFT